MSPDKTVSVPDDERKLQRLQSIRDEKNDFHPLLKRLLPRLSGIKRTEYTHGTLEHGADFVLQKVDATTGLPGYVGVVAKCGNVNKPESHRVIDQVRECHGDRFFMGGKFKIHLSEVWVTTTGTIAPQAQKNIFDNFAASNVVFIDREVLIRWIDSHFPRYWTDVDVVLGDYFTSLLSALDVEEKTYSLIPEDTVTYIEPDIVRFEAKQKPLKYYRKLPKLETVTLLEEVISQRFVIVQGDPGSGKSKCGRELARTLCDGSTYHADRIIPIKTTISELFASHEGSIRKFVDSSLFNYKELLEDKDNRFLVIADGLDELKQTPEEASKQLAMLSAEIRDLKELNLVVFTRRLSTHFGDGFNTSGAYQLEIRPFSLAKTIRFIKALCKAVSATHRVFEDLKKSAIFNQLPKSPIAAILLARILRENVRDLPSTLPELYRKYVEIAFGGWDLARGLQSQKEYDALSAILMNIAEFFMENQLDQMGETEAFGFFKEYLKDRNTGLTPDYLFHTVAKRCSILSIENQSFSFKHRTFAEFLFAKKASEAPSRNERFRKVTPVALSPYWFTSLYFYTGLLRDCPDLLNEVINLPTENAMAEATKALALPDLLLAAYNTPYNVIKKGVHFAATGYAKFLITLKQHAASISQLKHMSEVSLILLLQNTFQQRFAYNFFEEAIPDVVQEIALGAESSEIKAYSIFFLAFTYKELGGKDSFDFLLKETLKPLPIAIDFILAVQARGEKHKSKLLKRHEKHVLDALRDNRKLKSEVETILNRPLVSLLKESN